MCTMRQRAMLLALLIIALTAAPAIAQDTGNAPRNVQGKFQDIDRTARFDATGAHINPNFGTAIGISNPTRPPRIVQLSARFNF